MDDEVQYFGEPVRNTQRRPPSQPYRQAPPPRKKRRWGSTILSIILVGLLIFLIFYTPFLGYLMDNVGPYRVYPEEAEFTLQRTAILNGHGTYTVDYPEPFNMSNAQDVLSIRFNPYPLRDEKYGVLWDEWSGSTLGSRENIVMTYSLHTYTLQWEMDTSGSVHMIPDELKDRYTGDEWFLADDTSVEDTDRDDDGVADVMIQPTAPAISSLAHQLTDDKPDVYSKAKTLYDYMHDNFRYSTPEEMNYVQDKYGGLPKHAVATLRDGWGDCDEQSMLYISLLRAVGIPARLEMGMLYDSQTSQWGGHAWMQVYIPDSQGHGSWYNVDVVNSEFLLRDCNRITTWVDDGIGEHLSDYYHVFRGSGVSFSESMTSISYTSQGEVKVSTGETPDLNMPGFGTMAFISAVSVALILRKRR